MESSITLCFPCPHQRSCCLATWGGIVKSASEKSTWDWCTGEFLAPSVMAQAWALPERWVIMKATFECSVGKNGTCSLKWRTHCTWKAL